MTFDMYSLSTTRNVFLFVSKLCDFYAPDEEILNSDPKSHNLSLTQGSLSYMWAFISCPDKKLKILRVTQSYPHREFRL